MPILLILLFAVVSASSQSSPLYAAGSSYEYDFEVSTGSKDSAASQPRLAPLELDGSRMNATVLLSLSGRLSIKCLCVQDDSARLLVAQFIDVKYVSKASSGNDVVKLEESPVT